MAHTLQCLGGGGALSWPSSLQGVSSRVLLLLPELSHCPEHPVQALQARGRPTHLLHCTPAEHVAAALFSSSVVFCSCREVLAANSESLRSMITISISGREHGDWMSPDSFTDFEA